MVKTYGIAGVRFAVAAAVMLTCTPAFGQLEITRDFDASVPEAAKPAIHAAADWWESILSGTPGGPLAITITFTWANLPANVKAAAGWSEGAQKICTAPAANRGNACVANANCDSVPLAGDGLCDGALPGDADIDFNDDPTEIPWFFDTTTPHENEEFDKHGDALGTCTAPLASVGLGCSNNKDCDDVGGDGVCVGAAVNLCDLRTTAKHEIAHTLGFEAKAAAGVGVAGAGFESFNRCVNGAGAWACPPPVAMMVGGVGLGDRSHLDPAAAGQADDLMQPEQPTGKRREISALDVAMLVEAFGYTSSSHRNLPTLSPWSLIALATLLLTATFLVLRLRGEPLGSGT